MISKLTSKTSSANDTHYQKPKNELTELQDETLLHLKDFDDEYILRLAKSAFLVGKIPDDDSLIAILGDGYETKNSKAIENWIKGHINLLVEIAPKNHVQQIITEIENRLVEIMSDSDYEGNGGL